MVYASLRKTSMNICHFEPGEDMVLAKKKSEMCRQYFDSRLQGSDFLRRRGKRASEHAIPDSWVPE